MTTVKVSDSFDVNTDNDEWNDAFKVVAGTTPWTTADMSWYTEDYDITLTWYKGTGENKSQMEQSELFVPGEKYTLGVTADTKEISIEEIKNPEPFAEIQTAGFTVSEGITINEVNWYTGYDLEGYILDFDTFDEEDIHVNCGTKYAYSENKDGSIKIGVKFKTAAHSCSYAQAWEKDETNHWKVCECGQKAELSAHTYDAGIVKNPATETETGIKVYTCAVCSYTKTEDKSTEKIGEGI